MGTEDSDAGWLSCSVLYTRKPGESCQPFSSPGCLLSEQVVCVCGGALSDVWEAKAGTAPALG